MFFIYKYRFKKYLYYIEILEVFVTIFPKSATY